MFMDISERKRFEEQLLHDAFHDALTGLANRALFMDHLRMTIERCKSRHSNHYAVLFLDFDRFKVINDSLGHAEGDELLIQIARRLGSLTRTGDLLARLGGDEFVILLNEMLEPDDAIQVAERILIDLQEPFTLAGNDVFTSASIGIAVSTDGHRRAEDMLRDADIAMYRAKSNGKARFQVFNEGLREVAATRLQLETEIRNGIERREFEVYYQPILDLASGKPSALEALVRWQHPQRGLVLPNDFIPAAEESGLILPLGRWILRESCRQLAEWQSSHEAAADLVVNVNLSCRQFLQADLTEQVSLALSDAGLAPRCLKLEITESYLIENSEKAVSIMDGLRTLGVELSLDDFGTGYSSLSYLHRLPLNSLKIDRSFIMRLGISGESNQIVRSIIEMAQNLNLQVIAEGIETTEQLKELAELGCGFGQGYLFSRPLDAMLAEEFVCSQLPLPGYPPVSDQSSNRHEGLSG
jgi:diguanylate cyclase (GGDEF)-like protein